MSTADASAKGKSTVTLQNPVLVFTGIAPTSVPAGAFAMAVNGSGFVSGAQVLLAGAPLATIFGILWNIDISTARWGRNLTG